MASVRRSLRLPGELNSQLVRTAKERGFSSSTAFIRTAIKDAMERAEQEKAITVTEERLARQLRKLATVQQAQIALTDALAKLVLNSTSAYEQWLRSAAEGFRGNLVKSLQEME
jgi:metal-responsive CopG/Arc/MetJ family transcriptional regulator